MTDSPLCVSCAGLRVKERGSAVKMQRCPDCGGDVGVTAYGTRFRLPAARPTKVLLTPAAISGLALGAGLFAFVLTLTGMGFWVNGKAPPSPLPVPPPPVDLSRVPEVALQDPSINTHPVENKRRLVNLIANIKSENAVKQEGFLLAQIDRRRELRGMPFIMGDMCRLKPGQGKSFQVSVDAVRGGMSLSAHDTNHGAFWNQYLGLAGQNGLNSQHGIAALSQILAPEKQSLRLSLVRNLADSQHADATRALARSAIFDPDADVRMAAVKALKNRKEDYGDILMHGLRYPMAMVANRTALAMIALDRKDMLGQVADFLGETAPGDPVETIVKDQKACTVREVVRVNHHRNCLLCHAPTSTGDTSEVPAVMPIPGEPFPSSPSQAYGAAVNNDDPMVRADTTYLRQDFSMLLAVANAAPWPEMQRFDFLVRTRQVAGAELAALQEKVRARGADFLSENHRAALRVLRDLSGQDAAPNPAAWQRILGAVPQP